MTNYIAPHLFKVSCSLVSFKDVSLLLILKKKQNIAPLLTEVLCMCMHSIEQLIGQIRVSYLLQLKDFVLRETT